MRSWPVGIQYIKFQLMFYYFRKKNIIYGAYNVLVEEIIRNYLIVCILDREILI